MVSEVAYDLLRIRFEPRVDMSVTAGLAWMVKDPVALLHSLEKSCMQVARYARQPMDWVESQSLDRLNRWSQVLTEILIEERGGGDSEKPRDPFGMYSGDD